ncbi:MAG: hypothetical protein FD170_3359 [Bacteroidetes bacterium]|jgi:hypothetical protein|nr:MAG: hypothetical protein FD170_3359 [Bacteroidota bacterium]
MYTTTENRTIKLVLRKSSSENYLRFVFNSPAGQPVVITRDHELGQYLFSRVRTGGSVRYRKPDFEGIEINLIMPAHGNDCGRHKFSLYSQEDMVRINDYIESCAYLDFRMMVQTGNIDLKMDKKTVISIYSDLFYGEDKYEMLKKDEYRKRKKIKELLQSAAKSLNYK